jgi:glycosyltransferase involved in cell wall biosynthesis
MLAIGLGETLMSDDRRAEMMEDAAETGRPAAWMRAKNGRDGERIRWPGGRRVGVSCVIPTLNEERNIGTVLRALPSSIDEVILVDGESSDDTVVVSRSVRPDIRVVIEQRPGKGVALRTGFAAARGDVIVMLDADGSMDPGEIDQYIEVLGYGYDVVKGSRFTRGGGTHDMEPLRRWGNGALCGMVNMLYGERFSDLCYGFIAFRRECLDSLALRSDGFEIETEIVVRSVRAGLRVAEVPSFEAPRMHGESHLNAWRDGTRVLRTLLRHRFRPRALEPMVRHEVAASDWVM